MFPVGNLRGQKCQKYEAPIRRMPGSKRCRQVPSNARKPEKDAWFSPRVPREEQPNTTNSLLHLQRSSMGVVDLL